MSASNTVDSFWSFGRMPEIIEIEFHSKYLSDFQLSRLVQGRAGSGLVEFGSANHYREA